MDDIPIAPLPGKGKPSAATTKPGSTGHGATAGKAPEPRRDFLSKAAAVGIGGVITACPVAAGVAVIADPLMRSKGEAPFLKVASLAAVPDDGVPRQFPVIVDRRDDAWTRFVNEPIGAVFLCRQKGWIDKVEAWNATCPHAGCFVTFKDTTKTYFCPCHNSAFNGTTGAVISGPPPRDLDTLECRIEEGDILVQFQDFYVGIHEKKVKS